jgi:hypothetical protein
MPGWQIFDHHIISLFCHLLSFFRRRSFGEISVIYQLLYKAVDKPGKPQRQPPRHPPGGTPLAFAAVR